MNNSTLCIYHKNCVDGFAAATVVKRALGDIEFIAASYQEPPPDVTGKYVIIVDFSYPRDVLIEMAAQAFSIFIIDHHKTAQADLIDLPANVACKFNMDHSGAILAWNQYFPELTPPPALLAVEDRDLWRFERLYTREINAALFSWPFDFALWDDLIYESVERLITDGVALLRNHRRNIESILSATPLEMKIGGYTVPVMNIAPMFVSDVCHQLSIGKPFAAAYQDTVKGRIFSLRSADDGIDVSKIAQQYGGGGHKHAAGFRVNFNDLAQFTI